mmetsp:Transcript_213/g.333  ORF Transcript_213/g.333 Transcript_213/m.333 type:complete len:366 (+) Transcript_213:217-1314(+)
MGSVEQLLVGSSRTFTVGKQFKNNLLHLLVGEKLKGRSENSLPKLCFHALEYSLDALLGDDLLEHVSGTLVVALLLVTSLALIGAETTLSELERVGQDGSNCLGNSAHDEELECSNGRPALLCELGHRGAKALVGHELDTRVGYENQTRADTLPECGDAFLRDNSLEAVSNTSIRLFGGVRLLALHRETGARDPKGCSGKNVDHTSGAGDDQVGDRINVDFVVLCNEFLVHCLEGVVSVKVHKVGSTKRNNARPPSLVKSSYAALIDDLLGDRKRALSLHVLINLESNTNDVERVKGADSNHSTGHAAHSMNQVGVREHLTLDIFHDRSHSSCTKKLLDTTPVSQPVTPPSPAHAVHPSTPARSC